jgi:hypothetical protein
LFLNFRLLSNCLLLWGCLLFKEVIIEISDFPDYSNEETRCVLIMREHSQASSQLIEYFWFVISREHSVLNASNFVIFGWYVLKLLEFLEIVSFTL